MRYHHFIGDDVGGETGLTMAEFMFHNKIKEIISKKELNEILEKVKTQTHVYWTTTELDVEGIGFIFKEELATKSRILANTNDSYYRKRRRRQSYDKPEFYDKPELDDNDKEVKKEEIPGKKQIRVYIRQFPFALVTEQFNQCKRIIHSQLAFSCELTEIQEKVLLEIYERHNLNASELAQLYMPIDFIKVKTKEEHEVIINADDPHADFDIKPALNTKLKIKPFESFNEFMDRIRSIDLVKHMIHEDRYSEFLQKIEIVYPDLFTILPKEVQYDVARDKDRMGSENCVQAIIKVLEFRRNEMNYRLYAYSEIGRYEDNFQINVINENHADYNFIDENRIIITNQTGNYHNREEEHFYLDLSLNEFNNGKLMIDRTALVEIMRNSREIFANGERVITPTIYRFFVERTQYRKHYDSEKITDAIIIKYKELLDKGVEIKLNNVTLTKTSISVDGGVLNIKFPTELYDVAQHLDELRRIFNNNDMRYNFNEIFDSFLKGSQLRYITTNGESWGAHYKQFGRLQFEVNGMPIIINRDEDTGRFTINEVFCRIDDMTPILGQIICYRDVKDFNNYVKEVSYIGHEWKHLISCGVSIELTNPFYTIMKKKQEIPDKLYLRLSLLWDIKKRNRVYMILNGQRYDIKLKNKFKRFFNLPHRVLTMSQIIDIFSETIGDVNDEALVSIIENAITEAKLVKARGEELVRETISDTKANFTEIEIRGQKIQGYLITGNKTGAKFFIHKENLSVFKFKNGSWDRRCVVDDHGKNRIFEDRLANRLANIYNEPEYIGTIHN